MTMISFEDLENRVISDDLIGVNIHYSPREQTWVVWTKKRSSDGWSVSGRHPKLIDALNGATSPPPLDDWSDLI